MSLRRSSQNAGLSAEAKAEALCSGGYQYEQCLGWALSHLRKASWIERPSRGHHAINARGRSALIEYPEGFDYAKAREMFAPFWPIENRKLVDTEIDGAGLAQAAAGIPDLIGQIEGGINRIEAEVGGELLNRLRESHPDFFEQAVVKLLSIHGEDAGIVHRAAEPRLYSNRASVSPGETPPCQSSCLPTRGYACAGCPGELLLRAY